MLQKPRALKKHYLDAGKVPYARKKPFRCRKNPQPFLYHLFAEVFRPLPYIGNLFKIVPDSGWDISTAPLLSKGLDFRWLFPSSDPGIETTHALTDATPLADMIAACVDVEASFADPMSLSKPQVHPDLPDAPFFGSNAAWVSPGRFALQSAKLKKLPECTMGH